MQATKVSIYSFSEIKGDSFCLSLEIFYVFFEFFPLMGTVVCDIVAMFEYGDPNVTKKE